MNGAWIGDDERYQNANPDIDADRWLFNTQHEGQFGPAWQPKLRTPVSVTPSTSEILKTTAGAQRQTAATIRQG